MCVQDLDSLSTLPRLKYLSLLDNPVTKQPNYRLYVVSRCKKLKMLDFRKVKQKVRRGGHGGAGPQGEPGHKWRRLLASASSKWCCRARSAQYLDWASRRVQEREEAARLYGEAAEQAPQTFEPEEELKQVSG